MMTLAPQNTAQALPVDAGLTLYIVPAWSDQAGQCRIVACQGRVSDARGSYAKNPQLWKEAGHMNSSGKLVCLDAPAQAWQELKDCEPLAAGTQFYVEASQGG